MVAVGGVAEIEKSGVPGAAVVTVRTTAALCVIGPFGPVPDAVMVKGKDPARVEASAAIVNVVDPVPGTDAGLKFVVAPAGNPETTKVTFPAKPLSAAIAI
jgi:hypothetical protein